MATTKKVTARKAPQGLTISENTFPDFIEINRKAICKEAWLGVRVLARLVEDRFIDVKLCLEDDRYIIARFRLQNLYFVGYAKWDEETWFTLSEKMESSGSSSASSSNAGELFRQVSIKDTETMGWNEKFMKYSGGYSGGNTMMGIAGGGGGNTKKPGYQLTDMTLGEQALHNAIRNLLKHDPVDVKDPVDYMACAKSCAIIALMIAEPLRYQFLTAKIIEEWYGGYKICPDGEFLIKNWESVSVYVERHKGKKDDEPILTPDTTELKELLCKCGVKLGRDLKNIFGIVMKSAEPQHLALASILDDTGAHDKSKGKAQGQGKGKGKGKGSGRK